MTRLMGQAVAASVAPAELGTVESGAPRSVEHALIIPLHWESDDGPFRSLEADLLLMLTDVDAVMRDWGTAGARPIGRTTPAELRTIQFANGSMGPKVAAACRFVEATGGTAAIGALEDATEIVSGTAGTTVVPDAPRRDR